MVTLILISVKELRRVVTLFVPRGMVRKSVVSGFARSLPRWIGIPAHRRRLVKGMKEIRDHGVVLRIDVLRRLVLLGPDVPDDAALPGTALALGSDEDVGVRSVVRVAQGEDVELTRVGLGHELGQTIS